MQVTYNLETGLNITIKGTSHLPGENLKVEPFYVRWIFPIQVILKEGIKNFNAHAFLILSNMSNIKFIKSVLSLNRSSSNLKF